MTVDSSHCEAKPSSQQRKWSWPGRTTLAVACPQQSSQVFFLQLTNSSIHPINTPRTWGVKWRTGEPQLIFSKDFKLALTFLGFWVNLLLNLRTERQGLLSACQPFLVVRTPLILQHCHLPTLVRHWENIWQNCIWQHEKFFCHFTSVSKHRKGSIFHLDVETTFVRLLSPQQQPLSFFSFLLIKGSGDRESRFTPQCPSPPKRKEKEKMDLDVTDILTQAHWWRGHTFFGSCQ